MACPVQPWRRNVQNLLVTPYPSAAAVGGLHLRVARRGGGEDRDDYGPVWRPSHRSPTARLIDGLEGLAMEIEDLGKGFCQVLEQVKAISHLGCRGGPLPRAVGISFRAIAGDDLDPMVGLKPVCQGLRLTVREHGDRLAMFQGNQHGPIRLAFAEREVIHSKDRRGPTGRHWQSADSPQERVATSGNAQLLAQPGPPLRRRAPRR